MRLRLLDPARGSTSLKINRVNFGQIHKVQNRYILLFCSASRSNSSFRTARISLLILVSLRNFLPGHFLFTYRTFADVRERPHSL